MPTREMTWKEEIMELDIAEDVKRRIVRKINDDIEAHDSRIAKLECALSHEKELKPSIEWYDKQHNQDVNEMNRLNITIDVLIEKIEFLKTIIAGK